LPVELRRLVGRGEGTTASARRGGHEQAMSLTRFALALAGGIFCASPIWAQRTLVARADSAWSSGNRALARRLYQQAVESDSSESRAVFKLAQLEDSPRRALTLYRRYVRLEPRDPWGFMAMGDALAVLGNYRDALMAYDHAERLLPGERDAAIGRARTLTRAGRPEESVAVLRAWLARRTDDAEAWELLGRELLRAGRPRGAVVAFERAKSLGRSARASERIALARAQTAPSVEPTAGYQRDSDGNRTSRFGLAADVATTDGIRIAVGAQRAEISDAVESAGEVDGFARLTAHARSSLRLQVQGGVLRFDPAGTAAPWTTGVGEARLRLRTPLAGPALELRGQRLALGTTPLLVANHAVRTDGRLTVEMPVMALRLRGTGRVGDIATQNEPANRRTSSDLAIVLPLGWRAELTGQYHRLSYRRASAAGYFAPKLVETREAGAYFEAGDEGGVTIDADLGAGVQHVTAHGANAGPWRRALRGWALLTVPIAPARALWVELEAYDAAFALEGVTTSATWRFMSASLGLRWSLR